jgi:ligand-binding SRPBCC domain-containing protein
MIEFERGPEGTFQLRCRQGFPLAAEAVFPFFADAQNLERITPPLLRFEVVTKGPIEMGVGALIDYRLSLHGLPFRWRSQITEWEPPLAFTDTQLRGPYLSWEHQHSFENLPTGCLMTDHVRYRVFGGRLVHAAFVRRDLERIFRYRREKLGELLGFVAPELASA